MPVPARPTEITDHSRCQFWIDVGGTFTDCIARLPDGSLHTHKLLSSGRYPVTLTADARDTFSANGFLRNAPTGYFIGYRFRGDLPGEGTIECRVTGFDPDALELTLDPLLPTSDAPFAQGELFSDEEAPVAGIRWLLGLRLDEPIGLVRVRLGTTRATNALLERRGARTALVTTAGFADALRIGYQDRPQLFDLRIEQPPELYEQTAEIRERLAADGSVLRPIDESAARAASGRFARGRHRIAGRLPAARLPQPYSRNPSGNIAAGRRVLARFAVPPGQSAAQTDLPWRHDRARRLSDPGLARILPPACRPAPGADLRFMTSAGSLGHARPFQRQGRDSQRPGRGRRWPGAHHGPRRDSRRRLPSTWAARARTSRAGTARVRPPLRDGRGRRGRRAPDAPAIEHAGNRNGRGRRRLDLLVRRGETLASDHAPPGLTRARRATDAAARSPSPTSMSTSAASPVFLSARSGSGRMHRLDELIARIDRRHRPGL